MLLRLISNRPWHPQPILIYRNDLFVEDDPPRPFPEILEIAADDEWGFGDGPDGEMCFLLFFSEVPDAYFEHVGVVPASWFPAVADSEEPLDDEFDPGPVRFDVLGDSPGVGDRFCPEPGVLDAPLAHGIVYGSPRGVQRLLHSLVPPLREEEI